MSSPVAVLPRVCERGSGGVSPPITIRAGGLPHGDPVAERLLVCDAPIARVSEGRGGYPAPHLMRFIALQFTTYTLITYTTGSLYEWLARER